jgi:hypothetical protein
MMRAFLAAVSTPCGTIKSISATKVGESDVQKLSDSHASDIPPPSPDLDFDEVPGPVIWPEELSMPTYEGLGDVLFEQEFPSGDLRPVRRIFEPIGPRIEKARRGRRCGGA